MERRFNPPPYDEIIATYGLDLLKGGADIAWSPKGDFIVRDGDIQIGDERFDALSRLVRYWRYNAPTLQTLFTDVVEAPQRKQELSDELNDVAKRLAKREVRSEDFHTVNDEIGSLEFADAAYAGTVMVVLNNLLRRCWLLLNKPAAWTTAGPLLGGHSIGEIVDASAANFRHADEWARTDPPTDQQLKSIRVIADVLGASIAPNGALHPYRKNVCPEVLRAISAGDFEELNRKMFTFAHEMALAS